MFPTTVERRLQTVTCESRGEGGDTFAGRAVVYNQWSELIYGIFRERIAPGAFDECLEKKPDLVATVNHDFNKILGRSVSGTLKINSNAAGIDVEVTRGDQSYARDLAVSITRGDMRGMSFIFDVREDSWTNDDGTPQRTVIKADIYEVSFVFMPAYEQTEAHLRGVPLALGTSGETRAIDAARASLRPPLALQRRRVALLEKWAV